MWADWLKAYIPRTANKHRVGMTLVYPDREEDVISNRTGDPHSRRIKCVCEPCNNGWMSRLQETTKSLLVPMLLGQTTMVHREGQLKLAAWCAMMVMVAEHINAEMVAIPQSDRDHLRIAETAPAHWRIWISRHARKRHPLFTHQVLPFVSEEEFERLGVKATSTISNTQTTTICLGQHLLIHVMSSEVAWSIVRRWQLSAPVRANFEQIWPTKSPLVSWPPPNALTDDGIDLVANEFFKKALAVRASRPQ